MKHAASKRRALYQSYLVRLWQEAEGRPWCASVQSSATEKVTFFSNLDALFAFLLEQAQIVSSSSSSPNSNLTQEDDLDA